MTVPKIRRKGISMNLNIIAKIVSDEMAHKRSRKWNEIGDKYFHGQRVAKLAVRLRELIFPQLTDKDDILTVAAWFHDICNGHPKFHKIHGKKGAELVRELLANHCTAAELDEICAIIAAHDDRITESDSLSLKLQQDADHLDHFGADEILEECSYTAVHELSRIATITELQRRIEDKGEIWRNQLHFKLSRRIFDEKHAFVGAFIERYMVEIAGEIRDEARLLSEWDGTV